MLRSTLPAMTQRLSALVQRGMGWLLASLGLLALASCSLGADQRLATDAVARFHDLYNKEDYASIYAATDNAFQKTTSEAEYETLMSAVHRKLGAYKSAASTGWRGSETLSGTQVSLTFTTEFTEGSATEHFVFRMASGKPYLLGYNINSPLLIPR
jgi:hypothetical protein